MRRCIHPPSNLCNWTSSCRQRQPGTFCCRCSIRDILITTTLLLLVSDYIDTYLSCWLNDEEFKWLAMQLYKDIDLLVVVDFVLVFSVVVVDSTGRMAVVSIVSEVRSRVELEMDKCGNVGVDEVASGVSRSNVSL